MTHDPVSGSGESESGSRRGMDAGRYLARIGLDPNTVTRPDLETLARLQRAHATTVPFENLDIVGRCVEASRIVLSVPRLYEKVVERRRGGYCFELNGLFHWLLDDLGYDVDRIAAMVTSDGEDGHRKLSGGTLTETNGAEAVERTVPDEAWPATVRQEFGLDVPGDE